MPRAGLDLGRVLDAAVAVADADGLAALALARLAADLGVKVPSLYNHVSSLDGLRRDLKLRGLRELAAALRDAAVGRAGSDAFLAVADAQRDFARRHPGLYAASSAVSPADDDEVRAASEDVLAVIYAVLRGYGLEGRDAVHAVRALRAAIGGFVGLEAGAGFGMPVDVDESFRWLVRVLDRGLRDR